VAALGGALLVFGALAVAGLVGVRRYLAHPLSAEQRNVLGAMARGAVEAYERDGKLCASASHPVPASVASIRGRRYQSDAKDWHADDARNAGFTCLKFEVNSPQAYQYDYQSNGTSFIATAHGDRDGDGVLSTFTIDGHLEDGVLVVGPSIHEIDPDE